MSSERKKILEMLEEGKITSKEAADLLEAVDDSTENNNEVSTLSRSYSKKYLKIRVFEAEKESKVNLNIPIKLVKLGISFASKLNSKIEGVQISNAEIDIILEAIDNEIEGEILSIDADDGRTRVKIYIE
ncbi:MAG TPA: hypothetical protein VJ962_11800 [Clostridia bacterium]|nr:hypothetical protein [Clostridia bacterium]